MTTKTKVVNYTDAETKALVDAYTSATTDDERASVVIEFTNKLGKTPASIRAKLSRENVYIKPERKSKAGKAITKKIDLVNTIAEKLGVSADVVGSLEKATKIALEKVIDGLPD